MQKAKLKVLDKFRDSYGDWMLCKDLESGRDWIIRKEVYKNFRFIGLPPIKDTIEKKAQELLHGRHFPTIPAKERHRIIKDLLEATIEGPIQLLFPNLEL